MRSVFHYYVKRNGVWMKNGVPCETFPIQWASGSLKENSIPWTWAEEVYKSYSQQYGKSQSLTRMAERGGFGVAESIGFLIDRIRGLENEISNLRKDK